MMILRELQRRPLRTFLSALGMSGAVALIVLGHFLIDSLGRYLDETLRQAQRQDLSVTFSHPLSQRAIGELARMPGVLAAEGLRSVPVRARFAQRQRDTVVIGIPANGDLRRLVARRDDRVVPVPPEGVIATKKLGEVLGIGAGDRIEVEPHEGDRRPVHPVVVGFVDEAVGMQLYARRDSVAALEHDEGAVSIALLRVDPRSLGAIEARLRRSPVVIDVSDPGGDADRLRTMYGSAMDVWTAVSVTLAACVVFGVVYNNARIALATRGRDLASLRVLGMSRREISTVLIGGLAVEVLLAIPLGILLGRLWSGFFMGALDQESFRWAVFIMPRTYLLAIAAALAAALASALWVRRSIDHLDLIGVLKTRE
jgi:putative ABC transport system permease protein